MEKFFAIIIAAVVYCTITFGLGAWLNPYTINTWLAYFEKPANVLWWHGGLIGLVANAFTIPVALLTWIAQLFLA